MVGWTRLLLVVALATSGGLIFGANGQFGIADLGEIVTAIKLVHEIMKEVFNVWDLLKEADIPLQSATGIAGPEFKSKEQQLLERFREVTIALEDLGGQVGAVTSSLSNLKEILPEVIRLELRFDTFFNAVSRVHRLGAKMARYESRTDQLERYTLEDFAHTIVSHNTGSVQSLMAQIHSLAVGSSVSSDPGILLGLAKAYESGERSTCGLKQSPHQLVYSLYNLVALTELKGYAMMQFSWMLLRLYDKGNFTQEAVLLRETTECNAREQAAAAAAALRRASTEFWVCDPPRHRENKTFVQLTELLQAQLENEVDLNGDGTCKENCNYYQYTRSHGCYNNLFCSKQRRCKGRLFNCNFIDADADVCMSDQPHRRYDWVNYENGRVLGKKDTCARGSNKVDSWWRWLFWHCSYCLCVCDEPGPTSDRFFNLRPVKSDVANNRVVTGIRFVKIDRVIHMQIQEGEAIPRGSVNETTLSWKPVDSYDPEDPRVIQGKDYHMFTYEQRTADLDDIHAPPGHVCTGVKWRRLGSSINLEVMITPINFTTGKLKPDGSTWIGNDNTNAAVEGPRTKVPLPYPDLPTRTSVPSVPDSKSDMYLEFSHTSANSDVAQTTVPFFDAQDVTPDPATWLIGLGVYHKGQPGYGGFVALRAFTFNYAGYLNATAISSDPLNCV